eukprot:jgi/Botrbrau1/3975/Bobra.0365s0047.1
MRVHKLASLAHCVRKAPFAAAAINLPQLALPAIAPKLEQAGTAAGALLLGPLPASMATLTATPTATPTRWNGTRHSLA